MTSGFLWCTGVDQAPVFSLTILKMTYSKNTGFPGSCRVGFSLPWLKID